MSDMKTLVSVVTDNECLWLGEAWAACLCRGTSESYRSQAFDQGSVLWERRLKETSPGATKALSASSHWLFPPYLSFRSLDEAIVAQWVNSRADFLSQSQTSLTLSHAVHTVQDAHCLSSQ